MNGEDYWQHWPPMFHMNHDATTKRERNRGPKPQGLQRVMTSGSKNEEREMHGHEAKWVAEHRRGVVRGKEETRNWGMEKNGIVEVIYASCIIFYNAASPSPLPTALLSSLISHPTNRVWSSSLSHQGIVPGHTSQWLRFCCDATAALRKWKTGHNFPKMLFFITYFPFISLPHTIDGWWHLWQLNIFMTRFMGYLLLSFYSWNSVKMLISQIRRGRVRVYVCGMVSHPAECMHVWESRAPFSALQSRSVQGFQGFIATLKLPLHSTMD